MGKEKTPNAYKRKRKLMSRSVSPYKPNTFRVKCLPGQLIRPTTWVYCNDTVNKYKINNPIHMNLFFDPVRHTIDEMALVEYTGIMLHVYFLNMWIVQYGRSRFENVS